MGTDLELREKVVLGVTVSAEGETERNAKW
jgi:hypothetical protein